MRALVALLIAIFFAPVAFAANLHLDFRTFKVRSHFHESAASLKWNEKIFPFEWAFRYGTSYEEMSEQPHRRFGGHYVMVTTGCGTALQCGVLVDRRTGRIMDKLPLATTGYDYRANSNLLVVNPTDAQTLANRESYYDKVTYYYVWTTTGWKLFAEEKWPESPQVSTVEDVSGLEQVINDKRKIPIPVLRRSKLQTLFEQADQ